MAAPVPPSTGPPVVIIVPVCGLIPRLADNLRSLLHQDHPCRHLLLVTEDMSDAALPVIARLEEDDRRVRHIVAGQASRCCQKNYNLLAGVAAVGDFHGVLVFCDAGHFAPPHWLGRLVAPLFTENPPSVVSGYHRVLVDDKERSLVVIGRALIVAALGLLQRIPAASQPWGGATAMASSTFLELDVAGLWSVAVVDDVVLAAHLQRLQKKVTIVANAVLETRIDDRSLRGWILWLTRQWAYLKAAFPLPWLLLGLVGIFLTGCLYLATAVLLIAWTGLVPPQAALGAAIFCLVVLVPTLWLWRTHPSPGPLSLWLFALYPSLFMAGWCHGRTWWSRTIHWAGVSYRYGKKGRVLGICRRSGSH